MLRLVTIAVAIPTMFAAWAGQRIPVNAQKPSTDEVTLAGCVARQTGAGTATTAAAPGTAAGPLLLTRIVEPDSAPGRGAVPAGQPSTTDTGTISTRQAQPTTQIANERSYELTGSGAAALGDQVGKRVEVKGVVVEVKPVTADTAHPSSPRGRLAVASFRPLGGACPLG